MARRTKPRCFLQWHQRPREFICLQFLKAFQIHQFLWFLHGNIALLRKFSHSSLHSNWQRVQDFSPIFMWLFLPITGDTKPFSEEPKPDPQPGKTPFGLLLPAKLCSLTPAQSLACALPQQLSIRYFLFADKSSLPFFLPRAFESITYDIWVKHNMPVEVEACSRHTVWSQVSLGCCIPGQAWPSHNARLCLLSPASTPERFLSPQGQRSAVSLCNCKAGRNS